MKILIHEKYITCAKRANVLKALRCLAFCVSTCAGHVLYVLNAMSRACVMKCLENNTLDLHYLLCYDDNALFAARLSRASAPMAGVY